MGWGKGGLGTTNEINLCMLLENVAAKQKKKPKNRKWKWEWQLAGVVIRRGWMVFEPRTWRGALADDSIYTQRAL